MGYSAFEPKYKGENSTFRKTHTIKRKGSLSKFFGNFKKGTPERVAIENRRLLNKIEKFYVKTTATFNDDDIAQCHRIIRKKYQVMENNASALNLNSKTEVGPKESDAVIQIVEDLKRAHRYATVIF
jgi:hypothetical protein